MMTAGANCLTFVSCNASASKTRHNLSNNTIPAEKPNCKQVKVPEWGNFVKAHLFAMAIVALLSE